jgi:pimeloyl-ACP methyl ester carboxylesterase
MPTADAPQNHRHQSGSPGKPRVKSRSPREAACRRNATHQINVDPDWRERWAAVTVPTIVCSGDRTFRGMPEAADAVAAALPNASRRTLPGQGHRPAPEAMVPVLLDFLKS